MYKTDLEFLNEAEHCITVPTGQTGDHCHGTGTVAMHSSISAFKVTGPPESDGRVQLNVSVIPCARHLLHTHIPVCMITTINTQVVCGAIVQEKLH